MRIHVELDSELAPDRVREALLDFTDRRPRLWPNLDPACYKVLGVGDTWADVVEGNVGRPKIWAREHYDWSVPGKIEWRSHESNYCVPGGGIALTIAAPDDGGSHSVMDWEREAANWRGRVANAVVAIGGQQMMRIGMRRSLRPPPPKTYARTSWAPAAARNARAARAMFGPKVSASRPSRSVRYGTCRIGSR